MSSNYGGLGVFLKNSEMRMNNKRYFLAFYIMLSFCVVIGQSRVWLSWDVASLLYDTKLFLNGGTYVTDFFETNPPMIFLIYSPAVILSQITGISMLVLMKVYVILLMSLSLFCCSILLKRILREADDLLRYFILYILSFVFLLLPSLEFGQREHILLIFMMPYLLSAVLAAQGKTIHTGMAILIGCLAGLGFGLKPYFLPTLILVECYVIFAKRNIWSCFRIESGICASILCLFFVFIFVYHPNYIHVLLPLLNSFYFPAVQQSWLDIFTKPTVLYCLFILGCYIFIFKNENRYYRDLTAILIVAMCGMMLAFIIPRTAWWYHMMPAMALSCLLMTIFIYQLFFENQRQNYFSWTAILFSLLASYLIPLNIFIKSINDIIVLNRSLEKSPMVVYIRNAKSKNMSCLLYNTLCYSIATATQHEFVGRFPIFWWVTGLLKLEEKQGITDAIAKQKQYLINAVVEDFNRYRPGLIVVNTVKLHHNVSMLEYFLQNSEFREAWKDYHLTNQFDVFAIYERDNKG